MKSWLKTLLSSQLLRNEFGESLATYAWWSGRLCHPRALTTSSAGFVRFDGTSSQGWHNNQQHHHHHRLRRWMTSLKTDGPVDDKKIVLYKGRGMRVFRILVRFKIFQLSGIAASAIPLATVLQSSGGAQSTLVNGLLAGGLLFGGGVASTALWYYSRRYVGELSLLFRAHNRQNTAVVRFSVLDFWGNREDVDVSPTDILPPTGVAMEAVPFFPVGVVGDRQYILSLRYGHVLNRDLLYEVLTGQGKLASTPSQHHHC